MKLLEGKTAIVTGASRGIGRGIALLFAQHGANVAFTYLSSVEKGLALEQELQKFGTKIKGYRSDASKFDEAEKLVNDIVADFGTLQIVVNNAGINMKKDFWGVAQCEMTFTSPAWGGRNAQHFGWGECCDFRPTRNLLAALEDFDLPSGEVKWSKKIQPNPLTFHSP